MKEENNIYNIIIRHDTSENWTTNNPILLLGEYGVDNPILLLGEYGVEDDTHKVKRGNGTDTWNNLSYENFGITISFANINGLVDDNKELKEAFDKKVNKELKTDSETEYKVLTDNNFSDKYKDYLDKLINKE